MKILQYGLGKPQTILLIQGSCMHVEMMAEAIELLQDKYHLLVPVLPGHERHNRRDFPHLEEATRELEADLLELGYRQVTAAYGLSMGGCMLIKMADHGQIEMGKIILDGAITPYHYPQFINKLILMRDLVFVKFFQKNRRLGKKLIVKYGYTEKTAEDFYNSLQMMSNRSLKNIFYGCNNYQLERGYFPESEAYFLYGEAEAKDRRSDIENARKYFPRLVCRELAGLDHGQLLVEEPELLMHLLNKIIEEGRSE
ncbi:MAG: hypothetical protein Q4P65_02250 [Eubacteriales bacterium]|nr:hypothetical protein [Eubacteriales bacterium]